MRTFLLIFVAMLIVLCVTAMSLAAAAGSLWAFYWLALTALNVNTLLRAKRLPR